MLPRTVCSAGDQQLERLTNPAFGRVMSREQAEQRIAAQMPVEEKRKQAAGKLDEIDSSCSLDSTRMQIQRLVEQLKQTAVSQTRNAHHTRDY